MEVISLVCHPERMDRDTLYELRATLALYPYFQTARLLMLQNLYILHDPEFNEELRRASCQITDRRVVFDMVERCRRQTLATQTKARSGQQPSPNRTTDLIDNFLQQIPPDYDTEPDNKAKRRKPTPADAAIDYVAYLLETSEKPEKQENAAKPQPQLRGHDLIDDFIEKEGGKITLSDNPDSPAPATSPDKSQDPEESYFTETLARIYIKQGRYSKALEIIQRINLDNPKKNAYFADQIRFLEKLIINNKQKQ